MYCPGLPAVKFGEASSRRVVASSGVPAAPSTPVGAFYHRLETACREAETVLLDRRVFPVDEATWERFNALLDAPARDLPQLRKLLSTQAPWEQ